MNCSNMGCAEDAVSTVPGYPDPLPKCFAHEREYVDRYGHDGVRPLAPLPVGRHGSLPRRGRHSSGAAMAEWLQGQYDGNGAG